MSTKFECDHCGDIFNDERDAEEHIVREHAMINEVEMCDGCDERQDECACEEEEGEEESEKEED